MQAQLLGHSLQKGHAPVADGGSLIDIFPLAVRAQAIHQEAFHPLALGNFLLQKQTAQGDLSAKIQFIHRPMGRAGLGQPRRGFPGKELFDGPAQFRHARHILFVDAAFPVGGKVQVQPAIAAHGGDIGMKKPFQGMGLLRLMPEPAGTDGHIRFRRAETQPAGGQNVAQRPQLRLRIVHMGQSAFLVKGAGAGLHLRQAGQFPGHDGPFREPGRAAFVADPAHVGAAVVEDAGVGLIFPHQIDISPKIVFLPFAVGAFAAGAVKPHHEHIAVFREKLRQLGFIILIIGLGAVKGAIPIPGGKIEAEFDAALTAGVGKFPHHVALTAPEGRMLHGMFRIFAGPQAEAVMMLGGENQSAHARGFGHLHPLAAIQARGIENSGILPARAPFPAGKGIHAEMDKAVKAHIQPALLPLRGAHVGRLTQKIPEIAHGNLPQLLFEFTKLYHKTFPVANKNRGAAIASRFSRAQSFAG